jgi:hypothetical protein
MTIRFSGPLLGGYWPVLTPSHCLGTEMKMSKYALVYCIALAVASIGVTPVATGSAYAQSQATGPMSKGDFAKDPKKSLKKTSNTGERMGGAGGGRVNDPPRGGQGMDYPGRR